MRRVVLAGLAVALSIAPAPAAPGRDWGRTVTATPAGAYVLGNPKAKVRLVEYLSLTCSHCADFAEQAYPVLRRDYIASGKVALEVRHAVRDGFDMAASLLARCGGAPGYFGSLQQLFAAQPVWLETAVRWQQAQGQAPDPAQGAASLPGIARGAGIDRASGLPPQRVKTCLAAKPEIDRLTAMAGEAWQQRRINGTPTFLINGVAVPDASGWNALKPALDAALR